MPLGDRTGPRGQGQKTGRGAGYCNDHDLPGFLNPDINKGRGGRGLGVGPLRGGLGRGRSIDSSYSSEPYSSKKIWSDGPPD